MKLVRGTPPFPLQKLNFRVFRRNYDNITLLFCKVGSWELTQLSIEKKTLQFGITEVLSSIPGVSTTNTTHMVMVDQEANQLDPTKEYELLATFTNDKRDNFTVSLTVYPVDVLPDYDKDVSQKHVQLFGWHVKKKRWVKIPVVETDLGYAIPVVVIERKEI